VVKQLILPVGLSLALIFAMFLPSAGIWLASHQMTFIFIAVIFLINGYQTDVKSLLISKRLMGAFVICALVGFVAGPLLGGGVAKLLRLTPDLAAGIVVISTMAPTLSSVIVITQASNGNTTWSILLTVGLNLAAVFVVPGMLSFGLPGTTMSLPVGPLVRDLVLSVLVPFAIGIIARRIMEIRPSAMVNLSPTILIIMLSYMSFSNGRSTILASTAASIVLLIAALLSLHIVLLFVAFALAVLCRYQTPERKAIVFISSQKTLPAAIGTLTSLGYAGGAAAVPCVIYHFSQILCDSVIASLWRSHSAAAEAQPAKDASLSESRA
jgi:sodium/bile acid cotransporter 7